MQGDIRGSLPVPGEQNKLSRNAMNNTEVFCVLPVLPQPPASPREQEMTEPAGGVGGSMCLELRKAANVMQQP